MTKEEFIKRLLERRKKTRILQEKARKQREKTKASEEVLKMLEKAKNSKDY